MTIEQRLKELEKLAMEQAHELMAIDILLKSVIASHPDPQALRLALEMLSNNFSDQAREHAFSTGRQPTIPKAITDTIGTQVSRWLDLIPSGK